MADPTKIAFIGLGQMGLPMTRNLLRAGFPICGFDRNPDAAAALCSAPGFVQAPSAAGAVAEAEVVILMLPSSAVVDDLLWQQGLAERLLAGQIVLDMGSCDPVCSRANEQRLQALGVGFVDAPVSGGVRRAVDASLAIMIGGATESVDRVRPLLQALGKTLVHVGAAGAGHAVKALNNYVSAAGMLAACEALSAAQVFGIDPHLVNQVFNASTGKNNTTEHKVEAFMLSGAFNSGFALALMRKDLQTAADFIDRMDTPGDFARRCLQTWQDAQAVLEEGADHTALYRFIQRD